MAAKNSPLHRVIDAARWDAERPLRRLVIVAHAAFVDAGFVPASASVNLPRQVRSTFSLRYTLPPPLDAAAVHLRLCTRGRNDLVFHVSITRSTPMMRNPWLDTYWFRLDDAVIASAAAPILAGGLDDTARALRRDATPLAALWSALSDGLCRRVLVDQCARNGVTLEPTLMSLSDDLKALILARLAGAEDLARVECTCAGLRRLGKDRDATLWKPRYEKLPFLLRLLGDDDGDGDDDEPTEVRSWKERYVAARRPFTAYFLHMGESERRPIIPPRVNPWLRLDPIFYFWPLDDPAPEQPEEFAVPRPRRRSWRATPRDDSHGRVLVQDGHSKQRYGAGAVHSPSSRFRWKHR